jgi:signal transduction histidine kinase/ligand-binding sensor domain-containing protein/DNA-binding response OmpR family regulator
MREVILLLLTFQFALLSYGKTNAKKVSDLNQSFRVANSISNQQVTSFAEDSMGHIWIATIRGLNKFNIFEYQQYFTTSDSLTISDNRIQHIYKDSKNQLWVATVNGICKYTDQDNFERVPINGPSKNAIYLFENNNGRLFLNMNFAIYAYNVETNSFDEEINDIDHNDYTTRSYIDKSNNLWIVQAHQIRCYNSNTNELKEVYKIDQQLTFSFLDENGKLWLSSFSDVIIFDTKTRQYLPVPSIFTEHPQMKGAIITQIYPYNKSTTIIQTQNDGLFVYNFIENKLIHQSENGFPFNVPDFEITTFFTDSHKNLWIGSIDQGYSVQYYYKKRFNNNHFLLSKLENQSVTSIATDKANNIWMVTNSNGLAVYNNEEQDFKVFSNESLFGFLNSDFHYKAKKVFIDVDNNIWILSNWMLLKTRYENKQVKVKKWFFFPNRILSITQDVRGTIWLGGMQEKIYNKRKGESEFRNFHLYGKGFNFTPTMTSLSTNHVIIGSFNQDLQLIDPDTWEISTIPIKNLITYSKFVPTYLFEDSEKDIWIGTMTNGLYRYSTKEKTIKHYTDLACTDITSITEDLLGNIWVGTLYGLSKFDRTTEKFFNYFKTDGIGGNQFNEQSVCEMPDNSLIFGGTHGITYFNPIDVSYKRSVNVIFENLKIHNKLQMPSESYSIDKHLSYNPEIILDSKENSFTISYTAIDYSEFERVKYAYKLDGFDDIWIEANKNHEAYYSNIPSGKYTFRVKIYNDENTVVATENTLSVKIKATPYLSWYAISIYFLILYIIVSYILRILKRIKINKEKALRAEREKEQEHLVNKMNMSFFSNLSHEFRTPLTMISGPVSMLSKDESIKGESKKYLYIIQRNVNRMLRLVNQLMDFNKLENDTLKLKVKLTDIIAEIDQLVDVFTLNIKEKGVELITLGLEDNLIMWLDSDKLDKILTNLISNALKFSVPGGKIGVNFDVISREVASKSFKLTMNDRGTQFAKISVTDTGHGIPEDKLEKVFERYYQLDNQTKEYYNWGTGIGLYYARCLVELHHGKIIVTNRQEGGAAFSFILPIDDIVYSEKERVQDDEKKQNKDIPPLPKETVQLEKADKLTTKTKILIIDDDTEIVHYLRTLLSPHFDVSYKFDANTAYKALKEIEPELILCDVVMPGTDGFAFSQMVKENPSFCHIPIILVTAKATVDNQVEGLNSGADAYVTKPFDPAYLIALINSQLKNRKKIQSLLGSTTKTEKIDSDVLSPHDNMFMTNLYDLMEKELSNTELNINMITEVLKISRTKFYYKVKGLTGENPNVFFKTYKLNRAAEFLLEGNHNISEIADITGFSTPSHFSVSFKKQFGISPSSYNKLT